MFSTLQKAVTITFFRNASISHTKHSQGRTLQRLVSSLAAQHVVPPSPSPLPVMVHHSLLPVRMPVAPPVVPLPLRLPPLAPPIRPTPEPPTPTPAQPPTPSGDSGRREAARLIVIRRRKMRKHKLKKLRKRMRYVWAKVKLRRSIRREKAFQAEQMAMIADARRFDPRQYVQEIIEKSSTLPMATVRHGKRLPYFIRLELEKDNLIKQPK